MMKVFNCIIFYSVSNRRLIRLQKEEKLILFFFVIITVHISKNTKTHKRVRSEDPRWGPALKWGDSLD